MDTILGKVTLHGKVRSAEEKAKAESIAKKIDGVLEVRNLLQVVTPQREKAVQLSDDALKPRVEKALQADSSLKESSISVKSVNKGVVLLAGTAKTLSAHLRAVETVAWVPGVERVASEIKSPDALADAEIWREPTPQAVQQGVRNLGSCQRYMDHLGNQDALADRQPDAGARHQCGDAGGGRNALRNRALSGGEDRGCRRCPQGERSKARRERLAGGGKRESRRR